MYVFVYIQVLRITQQREMDFDELTRLQARWDRDVAEQEAKRIEAKKLAGVCIMLYM